MAALARDDAVRSIALYLEADGDGALLCEALAECAERGVGVAVLKAGESTAGAAAAAAHTGAVAGDQRVFRALVEEAGAAWAEDVHDLLELAKSLAVGAAPRRPACGSDPGLRSSPAPAGTRRSPPTSARGSGFGCRCWTRDTAARLRALLPDAATVGQPARLHGADLGRRGAAQRHHRHRRRRPVDGPDPDLLRPGHGRRARRFMGRGARGNPPGRVTTARCP